MQACKQTCKQTTNGLKHDLGNSNKAQNSGQSDQDKGLNTYTHAHVKGANTWAQMGQLSNTFERG